MASGNPTQFLSIVERNNPRLENGDYLIRIHGIGFQTDFFKGPAEHGQHARIQHPLVG